MTRPRTGKAKKYQEEAIAAYKQARWEDAVDFMTLAIEVEPKNIDFLDGRAQIYEKAGKLGKAAKDALQIIQSYPESAQGYLRGGKIAYLMKDVARALQIYDVGLKNVSTGSPGYLSIKSMKVKLGSLPTTKAKAYDVLSNLPPELIELIFDYLPFQTQLATRWVCRSWRFMGTSNPRLWKELIHDLCLKSKHLTGKSWQEVFQLPQNCVRSLHLDTSRRDFDTLFKHYSQKSIPLQRLTLDTGGRDVEDIIAFKAFISKHQSNLTLLCYWADNDEDPLFDFGKMRSLRSLTTNWFTVGRYLGHLPDLQSLSLMPPCKYQDRNSVMAIDMKGVEIPEKADIKKLSTLRLRSIKLVNLPWPVLASLICSETLTELQLLGDTETFPANENHRLEERELDYGASIFNALLNQCGSLRFLKWEIRSRYDTSNVDCPLKWKFPRLQELDIIYRLTDSDLGNIAQNCNALEQVSISSCSEITALGIAAIARSSTRTLRSVLIQNCPCVKPDIVDFLRAVLRPGARVYYSQDEGKRSKNAKKNKAW